MSNDLASKTIEELAPLIRGREISPVEVTEAVLERTTAYDEKINAFIRLSKEEAMKEAIKAEKEMMEGKYRGRLHGIPMALKDNLYFKNETVTIGSKIHQDFVPDYDATVVAKLKEAGVIFTGKLNMHEYAWGATTTNPHFGACRNPWNTEKIPGGSSGGSGAAVVSDMTIASLGTDTGGSIRIPASMCGIVGLKPTHGRISKYGCFPLSWSLDHIGPMTKSVYDSALLLEVLAGYDSKDPTSIHTPVKDYTKLLSADLSETVVGINEEYFFNNVDKQVEDAVRHAIKQLEQLGAKIETVKIPSLQYSEFAELVTIVTEASAIHHDNLVSRPEDFGDDVRFLLEFGELPSAVDYIQAQQIRYQLNIDFAQTFEKVDVLISPTLPFLPPNIGDSTVDINGNKYSFLDQVIRFTGPGNITGLPSLSIPCGLSGKLPIGMQIMGPAFKEENVLNVAYAYEKTNALQGKKPNLDEIASK
ncbi:Asp-tRNA(Asn)/Glu-tRNA(Gln) amidotransferase GatCAB subunit A [Pueribacillus theae]|uniref:Asp-tRNA(Asn)/Glu-tRNA(Gln) amidotransferase GatCAB subunit A n=1 Tax=Pueribacillus theae TaxID=2171751 RepID=A0A2U1JMP3_9BACI|nr:amidase [Pueribacillus theae]PWA06275.1 Asp-tRNA(Asn)/Glu-tRNA(Gln) amidotransferase GatCAB subunit A [Pueribacillus theae]